MTPRYLKKWREDNREKYNEYYREYRKKNKDEVSRIRKKSYRTVQKRKLKENIRKTKYYWENRDRILQRNREKKCKMKEQQKEDSLKQSGATLKLNAYIRLAC